MLTHIPLVPRFLADAMLARLARWLRVLGYDTAFDPLPDDRALVEWANSEDRVLLTRDRHLIEHLRPSRGLLLPDETPLRQLRAVAESLSLELPGRELFTRCLVCNTELRPATPEEAVDGSGASAGTVEPPVRSCPVCERFYWEGSHTRRMRAALERELPEWFG